MKRPCRIQGAIIHRNGAVALCETGIPSRIMTVFFGFSQAPITGASPCAVSRLPVLRCIKHTIEKIEVMNDCPVRILQYPSGSGANGNPLLPELLIKAAKACFRNMTEKQKTTDTNHRRSWQRAFSCHRTHRRSTRIGKRCGMPLNRLRGNGIPSFPAESSQRCRESCPGKNMNL